MNVWPLKFHEMSDGSMLFADDAGGFFKAGDDFLGRYATDCLFAADRRFLQEGGHAFEQEGDLSWTSYAYRWARRQSVPQKMNYVILVPTLRCNLACGYCQVSRAPRLEGSIGRTKPWRESCRFWTVWKDRIAVVRKLLLKKLYAHAEFA